MSISVNTILQTLVEEDQIKKAKAEKMKQSSHKGMKEVGKPKDPASAKTSIKQIEVPKDSSAGKGADKGGKTGIPQADYASKYVDSTPHMGMSSAKNEGSPALPSVDSMTPNQTTKMKDVKNAVRNTADDNPAKTSIPTSDFAFTYTNKMERGDKVFGTGNEKGGEGIGKQTVASNGEPSKKGGVRKAQWGDKKDKKATQVSGVQDNWPTPSDAPKKPSWSKVKGAGHNLVETGIALTVNGKRKHTFEVIDTAVLQRIAEGYEGHGYNVSVTKVPAQWKTDKEFLKLVYESIDAKYNFVPKFHKDRRDAAIRHLRNSASHQVNGLYESRDEFLGAINAAYANIEAVAEIKYEASLNLYEGIVRYQEGDDIVDAEIMTEATDEQMALRQIRNKIWEENGLDTVIGHIFVDGKKFDVEDIKEWS